jgi:diaminohydroxyphosphoribosylaminopyrimidine deaminase/5-amino-6-(5-phosphoribosylamino)uracil reductase
VRAVGDERFMRRALALARRGEGTTSPNPMVGAVVVRAGKIVGEGYHRRAGGPHAEVLALKDAGSAARGADLYVTLEPCCHFGRTPPCVDAIAAAGVRRVFVGMQDPNPAISGRGFTCMVDRRIAFHAGMLEDACRRLNERFVKHITTGAPFVVAKGAMTMDGVIATGSGDSKWITGDAARRYAHRLRATCDAVLVGVGTVLADDPELTARLVRPRKGQPLRVVLDSRLRIPETAKVVTDGAAPTVIFATDRAPRAKRERLAARAGVEVRIAPTENGRVAIRDALAILGARDVQSVLIEGGAEVHAAALAAGVVDRVAFFYAPRIAGGAHAVHVVGGNGSSRIANGWVLRDVVRKPLGADWLVEGRIEAAG